MWTQSEVFKQRLAAYKAATGKTQAQIAGELGTTYGTLRFWLTGTRPPKRENIIKAAELFGCSVTEFMDDPGMVLPGLGPTDMAEITAAKRAAMQMIYQTISPEDVTDAQAVAMARAWHQMMDASREK